MAEIENYQFRGLHPDVFIGTASDRYAGWIGQIYSRGRYEAQITKRTHKVGKQSFVEEVLPVECVEEYFQHFSILEIDYTFYRTLVDNEGKPTQTYQVLKQYQRHLREQDGLILKVPQAIIAQKLRVGQKFSPNESYLNPELFIHLFYKPAVELLGPALRGFIFEQEYQRRDERILPKEMGTALDRFFQAIPKDNRYHVELRTEPYLSDPIFEILEKYGVGQVLSHWTWLPPLRRQFAKSGRRFLNAGGECIIRLMTPLGVRYEDAYAMAFPFDKMVEGMMHEGMIQDTVRLMRQGAGQGAKVNVVINNRAGGNAPMIAQEIYKRFLSSQTMVE